MPAIEQIYLSKRRTISDDNYVLYVRDFRKARFPQLLALSLSKKINKKGAQKINDWEMLSDMNLTQLRNLLVEWEESGKELCFNIRWVAKLNAKNLVKYGRSMMI